MTTKIKSYESFISETKKISYSAIVLDDNQQKTLKSWFYDNYYNDEYSEWKYIGHHSTINLGELPPEFKEHLNKQVKLKIIEIGFSEKAIAVKVEENIYRKRENPHITLMTSKNGKPFDSNNITNWTKVKPFTVTGKIKEL